MNKTNRSAPHLSGEAKRLADSRSLAEAEDTNRTAPPVQATVRCGDGDLAAGRGMVNRFLCNQKSALGEPPPPPEEPIGEARNALRQPRARGESGQGRYLADIRASFGYVR